MMPTGPKKRPTDAEQKEKAMSRWDNEGGAIPRKRPKRPADVIGNAIRVAQIATGEAEEEYEAKPEKNAAAAELGRKGGAARAKNVSPERRAEIARAAAKKRWSNP
jgi:hypothetical protein